MVNNDAVEENVGSSNSMTSITASVTMVSQAINASEFGVDPSSPDNTLALQLAFDSLNNNPNSVLVLSPGVYITNAVRLPNRGVTLIGEGKAVLRAHANLPENTPLIDTPSADYTQSGYSFRNLVFDGNNLSKTGAQQTRMTGLVRLRNSMDIEFIGCEFRNFGYQLLALKSCRNVLIHGCEFYGAGFAGVTKNGGSAIWANQSDADLSKNIRILHCHIHDNHWHGCHVGGLGVEIQGCIFENNKEAHVFSTMLRGGDISTGMVTRDLSIVGNIFRKVRKKDISSHGLELQAWGGVVSNNIISDCDHGGVALSRSRDVIVSNNQIRQFGLIGSYGGVDIYNTGSGAARTANLEIASNIIGMDAEAGLAVSGIRSIEIAGGEPPINVSIHDNNLAGAQFTAGKLVTQSWTSANCSHRNNLGAND